VVWSSTRVGHVKKRIRCTLYLELFSKVFYRGQESQSDGAHAEIDALEEDEDEVVFTARIVYLDRRSIVRECQASLRRVATSTRHLSYNVPPR
jgi:hypothetical protein